MCYSPAEVAASVELHPSYPLMHGTNLEQAIALFTGTLGFKTLVRVANYAYVHRETAASSTTSRFTTPMFSAPNVKPRLEALPRGDLCGPVDQIYRQRELLVLAPDGNLIALGQASRGS